MEGKRIFNFTRYEFADETSGASLDLYDDGQVKLWVAEEGISLNDTQRQELADLLRPSRHLG